MFAAVIFDLDGTLLDSLEDIADAANQVLAGRGFPTHAIEAYKYFVGDGVAMLMQRVLPDDSPQALVRAAVDDMRRIYAQTWNRKSRLYDGIGPMLDALVRQDIKLAVLSNKPDAFTQKCAVRYLADWPFIKVAGLLENGPKKPDPDGALAIADHLGLSPEKIVFAGDTAVDMQTAEAAGIYGLGVLWGFRDREELISAGARLIVDEPHGIAELLNAG